MGVPRREAQAPTGEGAALSGGQEKSTFSCALLPPQARPWCVQAWPWESESLSLRNEVILRCCVSLAILDTSGHWFSDALLGMNKQSARKYIHAL